VREKKRHSMMDGLKAASSKKKQKQQKKKQDTRIIIPLLSQSYEIAPDWGGGEMLHRQRKKE